MSEAAAEYRILERRERERRQIMQHINHPDRRSGDDRRQVMRTVSRLMDVFFGKGVGK